MEDERRKHLSLKPNFFVILGVWGRHGYQSGGEKLGAGSGFARQAAPVFIMHAFKLPASSRRRCQAETSSEQRLLIEVRQ